MYLKPKREIIVESRAPQAARFRAKSLCIERVDDHEIELLTSPKLFKAYHYGEVSGTSTADAAVTLKHQCSSVTVKRKVTRDAQINSTA